MSSDRWAAYLKRGVEVGLTILEDISDDLPAPGSSIIKLAVRINELFEQSEQNQEDFRQLRDRLGEVLVVVIVTLKEGTVATGQSVKIPDSLKQHADAFERKLKKILEDTLKIGQVIDSKRKTDKVKALASANPYAEMLRKCESDLAWAMQVFDVASRLSDSVRLAAVYRKLEMVDSNSTLDRLPRAKNASSSCHRLNRSAGCFEGTRKALLKDIFGWMVKPDSEDIKPERFCWLNGAAGTGKTAVAYSVTSYARAYGLLGADFVFSRSGEDELRDPSMVFPTIAYQLARFDPDFGRAITSALERHPDAGRTTLSQQLDRLIVRPLQTLNPDPSRVVVVVFDAFDECEHEGAEEILRLLVEALPSLPFTLRVFITSRPEPHIHAVLAPSPDLSITVLHNIEDSIVKGDIELFLRGRLRALRTKLGHPKEWITDAQIKLLAEAAGTFFIHAATSIRFLESNGMPFRELLQILLNIIQSPRTPDSGEVNAYENIDKLYEPIVFALPQLEAGTIVAERFRTVVGSIILLRDPLPIHALACFTHLEEDSVTYLLDVVQSVIILPGPPDNCPRVCHRSFPDFLQDHKRCRDDRIWIDKEKHEARMAITCLRIMNAKANLHRNMLGPLDSSLPNSEVPDLESELAAAIQREVQYACRHWASHLTSVPHSQDHPMICEALSLFASRSILPWLEVMSWLGQTHRAVQCLQAAKRWVVNSHCSSLTVNLLNDAYRLLLAHFPTITASASRIAQSVVPFAPRDSQLVLTYPDYADTSVQVIHGADLAWSPCLMTLKGHNTGVTTVAVSSDGSRIATGSDGEIRVWDAASGDIMIVLTEGTEDVQSVAFSANGHQIVSGSWDKSVRLWGVASGVVLRQFKGHKDVVLSVAVAAEARVVASGSGDHDVRVWDIDALSDDECTGLLEGHSRPVGAVACFADGNRVVSGSDDGTIRVWDIPTKTCIVELHGHENFVKSVSVSYDGRWIASGSADCDIMVWDAPPSSPSTSSASFRPRMLMKGHGEPVNAVSLSRDGSRVISGSSDRTVRVWETTRGTSVAILRGHGGPVNAVAISADGNFIASGGIDRTLRIWDAGTGNGLTSEEKRPDPIISMALSPNGTQIVSLSSRLDISVWGTATGENVFSHLLRDTPFWASDKRVHFSSDGTRILVKLLGYPTQVFSASTGEQLSDTESHSLEEFYPSRDPFTVVGENLMLRGSSRPKPVCVFAPEFSVRSMISAKLDETRYCIALVRGDGRLVILHIVL